MLQENEKKAISKIKEELSKRFNILNMVLYGSKARGDSSIDSDVDIMIELDNHDFRLETEISDIIYNIDLEFDTFTSPVYFSRKEIEEGPVSESPIYKAIQREGVPL